MSREDAYMLASVAVDFCITQLVDGNKGVHAMIPKSIFHWPLMNADERGSSAVAKDALGCFGAVDWQFWIGQQANLFQN